MNNPTIILACISEAKRKRGKAITTTKNLDVIRSQYHISHYHHYYYYYYYQLLKEKKTRTKSSRIFVVVVEFFASIVLFLKKTKGLGELRIKEEVPTLDIVTQIYYLVVLFLQSYYRVVNGTIYKITKGIVFIFFFFLILLNVFLDIF